MWWLENIAISGWCCKWGALSFCLCIRTLNSLLYFLKLWFWFSVYGIVLATLVRHAVDRIMLPRWGGSTSGWCWTGRQIKCTEPHMCLCEVHVRIMAETDQTLVVCRHVQAETFEDVRPTAKPGGDLHWRSGPWKRGYSVLATEWNWPGTARYWVPGWTLEDHPKV